MIAPCKLHQPIAQLKTRLNNTSRVTGKNMEQDILDKPFLPLDRLRILKYFSVYSVIITFSLLALYFADINMGFLGLNDPKLYPMLLALHGCLTVVFLFLAFSAGQAHYDHLIAFFLLDISLLAGLIYSSGTGTSLSYLMIVGIAVANSLVSGQKGLLVSAWAAICIVFIENRFAVAGQAYNYVNAGTLGIIFFITALVIQSLVKRLHLSVDINRIQADSLLSMEQLTKLVLKRLETGIVVMDSEHQIIFQNASAQRLLGFPGAMRALPDKLQRSLNQHIKFPDYQPKAFKAGPTTAKVQPLFTPLMPGNDRGTVIFLEDTNVVYQEAQRLKQVSLGKLAACIVREIREPMQGIYKIAHEVSVKAASSGDNQAKQRIKAHSGHIERIINTVQSLSTTRATDFEKQSLGMWISEVVNTLSPRLLSNIKVELKVSRNALDAYMDSHQLRQAISNLLENAVYYAKEKSAEFARVTILVGRSKTNKQAIIEIQDNGYGVGLDDLDHIFEPFYSSENNKPGLGLYLAKQFCEMNMARLDYVAAQEGARFRITFPSLMQVEQQLKKKEDFNLRSKTKEAFAA